MFEHIRSTFGRKSDVLQDAQFVSRYAAEVGIPAASLREAILAASNGSLTPTNEKAILDAQSEVMKDLGVTNLRAIRSWYSKSEQFWSMFNRFLSVTILAVALFYAVDLNLIFNQMSDRLRRISQICSEFSHLQCPHGTWQGALSIEGGGISFKVNENVEPPARKVETSPTPRVQASSESFDENDRVTEQIIRALYPPVATRPVDWILYNVWGPPSKLEPKVGMVDDPSASYLFVFNTPDKIRAIAEDPNRQGLAVDLATQDFHSMSYVLGGAVLPILYGVIGSAVFLLRKSISGNPNDWMVVCSFFQTVLRIALGGVAGLAIGWFNINKPVEDLTNFPFALAFVAGFSIDIVFSLFDRLIAAFDFRRTGSGASGLPA